MTPILQLANATVVKDGAVVLDDLTLTIGRGDHTAIIGPNGAGKSTLMNLLTLDERPIARPAAAPGASGPEASIRLFGRDTWNVFELRPRLGVVSADLHHRFVAGNSAGRITARDAVLSGFFAAHGFVDDAEATAAMRGAAGAALARMGVAHLAGTTMDRMSTGEARRVLIARALVTEPEALVLDEPTTGLDLVARHQFLETIRVIARQGTTLILVTHRVEEVIPEIQSVVLLRRGRIAAAGSKALTLTSGNLSAAFEAPIALGGEHGYYVASLSL